MNTLYLTAKKDFQGGYTIYFTGTQNVAGTYYPSKKAGWCYLAATSLSDNIEKFDAKTLKEAKETILKLKE